jgi:hypothetical protein
VREFEEAVAGAMIRHAHALDLVMRHALVTGQWAERVTFRQLTGREGPLPFDPRGVEREPVEPEVVEASAAEEGVEDEQARAMRAWMQQAEAQIRASGSIAIEGDSP